MNRTSASVLRPSFDTRHPYESFRRQCAKAVTEISSAHLAAYAKLGARWDEVVADAASSAPHGFFIYWHSNLTLLMSLAGNTAPRSAYPVGNHTIAQRTYRHDPAVTLHARLRTLILAGDRGVAWFTLDQQSSVFASFAIPEITEAGIELDAKVPALLTPLDVRVP